MYTLSPGTQIGSYEIVSRPMMGGMGVVYFALDHADNDRPVALKTFKPEYLPDRAARDRFLREGSAWVQLGRYAHIVRCYKVEYIDPTAFLVLELIAKEQDRDDASLRSWMGAPMPVEQALLFVLQIARGMKHAAETIPGFVHRDLKPENILVGADKLPGTNINRLRVTDFGLVKFVADSAVVPVSDGKDEKPNQAQFTRGAGTPLYMAPEQWKGEPVGVYTDVYALGCILYEMLTGQRAASGHTIDELQAAHCGGRLRSVPGDLPGGVQAILRRSMSLVRGERYKNWGEVISEIELIYLKQSGLLAPRPIEMRDLDRDDNIHMGWSYNELGLAYQDMGDAQVATGYFKKALSIAKSTNDLLGESIALGNLGLAYAALGDLQHAIGYHEQQLTIVREINYLQGEGTALNNLGLAYADLGDPDRAVSYYEQALVVLRKIGDRSGEGNALNNLGETYRNLGDIQRAISYYEQAIAIAREISDRRSEGNALGNLGNAYLNIGDVRQAIQYYEKALEIDSGIGDRRGEGVDLGNLGEAYRNLGDFKRAINCYEQQIEIAQEIGDRHGKATAIGNLGNAYANLGDFQRALEFYEHALLIRRDVGAINLVASTSFNMAILYAKQGETARALSLALEAEQAFVQSNRSEYAQRARTLVIQLRNTKK